MMKVGSLLLMCFEAWESGFFGSLVNWAGHQGCHGALCSPTACSIGSCPQATLREGLALAASPF